MSPAAVVIGALRIKREYAGQHEDIFKLIKIKKKMSKYGTRPAIRKIRRKRKVDEYNSMIFYQKETTFVTSCLLS